MVADPPMRFKHVFVTGASGIVGAPLCRQLSEMGIAVTAYTRAGVDLGLASSVRHVQGDILDPEALASAAHGAEVIFHVAGAVHGSASTYSEFERINVLGTANVVRVAADIGAKLIHVSTVNVEGFRRGLLTDPYSATKAQAESLILNAVDEGGLFAVIVRPAMVFGHERGRAGLIVDRMLHRKFKVLPAPSRMISPVWSGDLAVALIRAAEAGETGETYTVAGPSITTGEFVAAVAKGAGVPKPLVTVPAWAITVPLQLAWWGKRITRWTPPVSVESVRTGSAYDGRDAADVLNFSYTPIRDTFSSHTD